MRETVKYERTVIVPIYLANKLDNLKLEVTYRTRALKFIRLLIKNSKQVNDDNDMFNTVEFPRNYLVKILGGSYNEVLQKLIEGGIIERSENYSTINHKCKKFTLRKSEEIDYKEIGRIIKDKLEEDKESDNESTMCTFLQKGLFKEYTYLEKLDPQSRELTNNFREALSLINLQPSKFDPLAFENMDKININNFKVNEQIIKCLFV